MKVHTRRRYWLALLGAGLLAILPHFGESLAASAPRQWLPMLAKQGVSPSNQPGEIPAFTHIFTIVFENTGYDSLFTGTRAPYFQSLAKQYAVAENYYGIQHPSLPNYLAMVGGDTFGINKNCTNCTVAATNIVDQLEAAGKSWKAYMEAMPQPCSIGDSGKLYRQKHNPFIYFDNIRSNPARCNKIVPFSEFATDLANNTLPEYVWITPDMCNSMHDCSVSTGDAWLHTWGERILASPAWQNGGVLFITFDEGDLSDDSGCCQYANGGRIATLVISPLGRPGYRSAAPYSHYSLLRTIESAWNMPPLGKASCACSTPMADFFDLPAQP